MPLSPAEMAKLLGVADEPPGLLGELGGMLTDYSADQPRSRQTAIGPSEMGTPCVRQLAYKVAGTRPVRQTSVPWASLQGTAVHSLMEKVLRWDNARRKDVRWLIEQRVEIDEGISGHSDAYDLHNDEVDDWKRVGPSTLEKVAALTPKTRQPRVQKIRPEYRTQVHLYGLGMAKAGLPVRSVRIVFLAGTQSFGDSEEWSEPYNPDIAFRAIDRYWQVVELVQAGVPPHLAPASASHDTCRFCPFRRGGEAPADEAGCPGSAANSAAKAVEGIIE